ncbi:protein vip1 [Moniliophthora roreri]|nr:protein vip1 [Moniliophthora roreri]
MSSPVHVSGISPQTTEDHLRDFFTILSIEHKGTEATIVFEKASAANTALMLNGGTLDGATLTVTSEVTHEDEAHKEDHHNEPISQSDKPRAGIAAEYLAKGYKLSDNILQRAIELDQKRGISQRFLSYIQSIDTSLGARALGPEKTISGKVQETVNAATQQAKTIDEQKGISKTAGDYYSKALTSPWGQTVLKYYTTTSKQVLDIHEEAKRIAAHRDTPAGAPETQGSGEAPNPTTQAAPTVV